MKKKFIVTFEVEAKEDLDLIQAKTGLRPGFGSFRKGSTLPSMFKPRSPKARYPLSRLSIRSTSPANAGLERQTASLIQQLQVRQLLQATSQLSKCRLVLRIGVFFDTEPPAINLPQSLLGFAATVKAELTIDYYRCSSMEPVNLGERRVRAKLLKKIRGEQNIT